MIMLKRSAAFTLIELMVVVAIIAILSTMGVANFSTAIKRSRNAVRQNDVLAVSKGLEACYDVMSARYLNPAGGAATDCHKPYESTMTGGANGVFKADSKGDQSCQNRCLNQDIKPNMNNHNYTALVGLVDSAEKFVICAKLENVGNVESIGNSKTDLAALPNIETAIETLSNSTNKCDAGGGTGGCFFCVTSSQ